MSTPARPLPSGERVFASAYGILALGGALCWACTFVLGDSYARATAVFAPAMTLLAALAAGVVLGRRSLTNLVSPTGALTFTIGVYFGFGAMVPAMATGPLQMYLQDSFPFTFEEIVKVHRVTGLGIAMLTLTGYALLRAAPPRRVIVGARADAGYLRRFGYRMVIIGTAIRLLITTPYLMGSREGLLNGTLGSLEILAFVGLMMFAFGVAKGILQRPSDRIALVAFGLVNAGLGVLSLSKMSFFLCVGAVMAGIMLARPRVRTVMSFGALIVVSYAILSPLVALARIRGRTAASFSERFQVVSTAAALLKDTDADQPVKGLALLRFSYAHPSVFAIREYDAGLRSQSMTDKVFWVLIPRILWPDKPNMTATGLEVSIKMFGQEDTLTGIGLFAEGYWNAGYLGVILASIFVGLIISVFERLRWRALETFDIPNMFVFWNGCYLANETSFLVPTYIGSIPLIVGGFILLRIVFGKAPDSPAPGNDAVMQLRSDTAPAT